MGAPSPPADDPLPTFVTVLAGGLPERVAGAEVSAGYFDLLGLTPSHGREFTAADATPAGPDAMILSDAYWRQHFGGDPSAVAARSSSPAGRSRSSA